MLNLVPAQQLRIGIVGYTLGRIRYGAALSHSFALRVVGIADMDVRSTRTWSRDLPGKPPLFPNLTTLLAGAEELNAVLIAVPLRERSSLIAEALRAGKPVLCDFPFTVSLAETDTLLQLAEENNVPLIPFLPRRFDPWFEQATRVIEKGTLGTIRHVRCDWSFPLGLGFALENGVALDPVGWHELLQAIACQTADICRWWLGDAETVSADIDLPEPSGINTLVPRNAPDPVANLIVGHVHGQSTHLLSRSRAVQPGERYVLTGTTGHLELIVSAGETVSAAAVPSLTLYRSGQKPETIFPETLDLDSVRGLNVERTHRLLMRLAETPQSPSLPEVSGADARAALEIVQAAYLSAQDKSKVTLPLRRSPDIESLYRV